MDQDQDQDLEVIDAAPIEPLSVRNQRSKVMGEYYRTMATNYQDHDRGLLPWPTPPYPPQRWATNDAR